MESTCLGNVLTQEFFLAPYERHCFNWQILLYHDLGTRMKRRSNRIGSKEIRRAAFPKPLTEEFRDGCMTALQCTSYEAEVTGCDKRMSKKRHQTTESLSLHPVGIGCVCGRDDDSAPARCRSRVSWWVKGIPDRIETQSRVKNEMLCIQILALASNNAVDAS